MCPEGTFVRADMFDPEADTWRSRDVYDIVLLMPGRLLEVPLGRAAWLRAKLRGAARKVVLYTYDKPSAEQDGFRGFVQRCGFRLIAYEGDASVGLAEVIGD